MQKWEYILVEASLYSFGDKLISIYVNSKEWREWKNKTLYQLVNYLGDEGWELITFSHNSKYEDKYLIFKRPKITI